MARKEIPVETRQVMGKKVAQLRRQGYLPGNVFGNGLESVAVQAQAETVEKTLRSLGANEVVDLKIEGERNSRPVVLQKVQRHPLNSSLLHLDFYQVSLRQKMRADVPLVLVGESEGVKTYNGVLLMAIESVSVEALPLDIPSRIEVDVTPLENLEDSLQVKDLPVPPDVTILTDEDMVVVKVSTPRVAVEDMAEEAAAEEAAAEAAAEGETEGGESSGDAQASSEDTEEA